MIDSHLHLSYKTFNQTFPYIAVEGEEYAIRYGNRESLIKEMKNAGITYCIEPAIDVDSNRLLLENSLMYPDFIYPAVGNHPTRCIHSNISDFERLSSYAKNNRIIAIGETGLDYHYNRLAQHRLRQKVWFRYQINLADQLKLPLILHIRMADKDAISILLRNKDKLHGGVYHCFKGGSEIARQYTELGFCLGIGGSLLMKSENSNALMDSVKNTPLEYLMLETDGPYVKPAKPNDISKKSWEKARNTSLILPFVVQKIAEVKSVSVEDVIRITEENTRRVFKL